MEYQNIVIERRYTEQRKEAALAAAEELVRLRVDVIVVASTLTALAAKQATTTVPIVVTVPGDPVAAGLVTSLARPGGNVTGLSFVGTELAGKQVELLKEAVPRASDSRGPRKPHERFSLTAYEGDRRGNTSVETHPFLSADAGRDPKRLHGDGEAPSGGTHCFCRCAVCLRDRPPRSARPRPPTCHSRA